MSFRFFNHSYIFNDVYLLDKATIAGPKESKGPLNDYFDQVYNDYYCKQKTFEKAERKMLEDALYLCLKKAKLSLKDIDLYIGGDLTNQITSVHYLARNIPAPFIGIYGACSSFALSSIICALMIEAGYVSHAMSLVSSHNLTAERQFRYPCEYGVQRRNTSTFTATGAIASLYSSTKSSIKVESMTLGQVIDYQQNDANDMGRVMAIGAYDTIMTHFKDLNRSFDDYDCIFTGDLSGYGLKILKEMLGSEKINDCGCLLYDVEKQNVNQGGSGCACSGLVTMAYLYELLKNKTYKRILIVSTGALLSPLVLAQKETIPTVAHAFSLEVLC